MSCLLEGTQRVQQTAGDVECLKHQSSEATHKLEDREANVIDKEGIFPSWWLSGVKKSPAVSAGDMGSIPGLGKIPHARNSQAPESGNANY